jgi:hypothetical protein
MRKLLCVAVLVVVQGSTGLLAFADEPAPAVNSQRSPICFPGVCLKKGMRQADALRKLAGAYQLVHLGESQAAEPDPSTSEESYIVKDEPDSGRTVGVVSFVDGRVSWASKAWGYTDDQKAAALVAAVYSLIERLSREHGPAASVETKHSVQGNVSVDQIKFLFGSKDALITIMKQKGPDGDWATEEVHVDEALKEESDP